jgi:hypothetical protein
MDDGWDVLVRVTPDEHDEHDDQEELLELGRRLRAELLDLDVESVNWPQPDMIPDAAKAVSGLAGMMAVRLGKAALKAVLTKIRDWIARTGRSVEVTIGGDTIKLTNATPAQQETLINVWLARHAPSA